MDDLRLDGGAEAVGTRKCGWRRRFVKTVLLSRAGGDDERHPYVGQRWWARLGSLAILPLRCSLLNHCITRVSNSHIHYYPIPLLLQSLPPAPTNAQRRHLVLELRLRPTIHRHPHPRTDNSLVLQPCRPRRLPRLGLHSGQHGRHPRVRRADRLARAAVRDADGMRAVRPRQCGVRAGAGHVAARRGACVVGAGRRGAVDC